MTRELVLGNDPQSGSKDTAVYGYRINGDFVWDPRSSLDGRATVDPLSCYGVKPAELDALDSANKGLLGRIPRKAAVDPIYLASIREEYPQFRSARVGGNCTALRANRPDGSYLLLTASEETREPNGTDATLDCFFFHSSWECEGSFIHLPAREVKAWIVGQWACPLLTADEQDQARLAFIVQSRQLPEGTTAEQLLAYGENLDADDVSFLERLSDKELVSRSVLL
jgi:hypothetical protein